MSCQFIYCFKRCGLVLGFLSFIAMTSSLWAQNKKNKDAQVIATTSSAPGGATIAAKIPEILPPSPEAASFMRTSIGTVNMSTGGLSTNIPIYEIKMGNGYTFPINISYGTQGLKASDLGSRVGMGWSLVANGVINRIVRGVPDELLPRKSVPAILDNTDYNYAILNNLAGSPMPGSDAQSDEYLFSVNGLSGRFVIDTNFIARVTSAQNCRIKVYGGIVDNRFAVDGFLLTGPDGTKYSFRDNTESTQDFSQRGYSAGHDIIVTAYYLDHIDFANGEYIDFLYTPITVNNSVMVSQNLTLFKLTDGHYCDNATADPPIYESRNLYTRYNTKYLTRISASNDCSLSFQYQDRADSSKDNLLQSIAINPAGYIYKFNYCETPGTGSQNYKRFFLTRLVKLPLDITDSSYAFLFDYNNLNSIPGPSGINQDLMGYYKSGVSALVPNGLTFDDAELPGRGPSFDGTVKGSLRLIKYPEGGTEEYYYEPNRTSRWEDKETKSFSVSGSTQFVSGSYPVFHATNYTVDQGDTLYSFSIPCNYSQTTQVTASASSTNGSVSDSNHCILQVDIYENNVRKYSKCNIGYAAQSFNIDLVAGNNYKMDITIKGSYLSGTASFSYLKTIPPYIVNQDTYGMRVKKIRRYDPVSGKYTSKFYTYGNLTNMGFSSIQIVTPYNISSYSKRSSCVYPSDPSKIKYQSVRIFHSNSINGNYDINDGNPISYHSVIESDDSLFLNGGIQYNYPDVDAGSRSIQVLGSSTPIGVPETQAPTMFGKVLSSVTFNANFDTLQYTQNLFETLVDMSHYVPSWFVNKLSESGTADYTDRMQDFNVVKMFYSNNWIRPSSTISTTYNKGVRLRDTTSYYYGDFDNVLLKRTVSRNSNGELNDRRTHYATDYVSNPVAQKMILNNLVEQPFDDSLLTNNRLVKYSTITYKDWFNDGRLLLPQVISTKESALESIIPRIVFTKYDSSGSLLEATKWTDAGATGYLWDTIHKLPVCQFKNTSFNDIAYCGFETGETGGNWQQIGGSFNDEASVFGKSYTGQLRKQNISAGTYIVRLWTMGAATVNTQQGILKKTFGNWKLLEWTFINPGTVLVDGAHIDEVKLFPLKAALVNYSYYPFVGIKCITDQNDIKVFYEYDSLGRLLHKKDELGNIIGSYDYHYKMD